MQQCGLPLAGEINARSALVDRALEGSRYQIADKDLECIVNRFSKVLLQGVSATVRNLQLQASMAEVESGFQNGKSQL